VLALLKRVASGLPRIDPITDLYNAVSIDHALPVGGEDFDAYVGPPRLTLATGDEPFDTIDQGEPVVDHPAAGEVIWRDDLGVTCRRWNWRQGVRTRIGPATTNAIFLLEALGAMPDDHLGAAGDELMSGLRAISPDVALGSRLIGAPGR
jgi:DNA/RNA-binding domain of Phe-tRNA-synthetase-like protein